MRLARFVGLVVLAASINSASGSLEISKAQTPSESEVRMKNWVLTSSSETHASIARVDEITKSSSGNLYVISVTYSSTYSPEAKLRGFYLMLRDEVNCASKSSATREAQMYSLRGVAVGERSESDAPLARSFPETVLRREIEKACRLAEFGPEEDDITFESVSDFIRISEALFPPKGPVPNKAAPKRKTKPR